MKEDFKNTISLPNCSMASDGIVTCKVSEKKFDNIHRNRIKPKKIVFEIEDQA